MNWDGQRRGDMHQIEEWERDIEHVRALRRWMRLIYAATFAVVILLLWWSA